MRFGIEIICNFAGTMEDLKEICVFAASSSRVAQRYVDEAYKLGREFAAAGVACINGAGREGLMRAVSDGVLDGGGRAVGIIPQFMVDNGWCRDGLTELVVTPDMHVRKETIVSMGDATIALPGGCGTLEELLEIITWKQLGLYSKPIIILNTCGFFNPLLEMFRRAVDEHFMRPIHTRMWSVAQSADEAVELILSLPEWDRGVRRWAAI